MKQKNFIDYLQELFTDISDAVAEPVFLVFNFLDSLPGFSLVSELEILPEGILIKGRVADQRRKFEFEFHGEPKGEEVKVILNNQLLCSDSWAEATRELVDTVSPGDRMMTVGSPFQSETLFSYCPNKKLASN